LGEGAGHEVNGAKTVVAGVKTQKPRKRRSAHAPTGPGCLLARQDTEQEANFEFFISFPFSFSNFASGNNQLIRLCCYLTEMC